MFIVYYDASKKPNGGINITLPYLKTEGAFGLAQMENSAAMYLVHITCGAVCRSEYNESYGICAYCSICEESVPQILHDARVFLYRMANPCS